MTEGLYTSGAYAPVTDETSFTDLPVLGAIPRELDGLLVRNGPNPTPSALRGGGDEMGTWFTGDGMLHGFRIRDGKASWYRNRYIKTGVLKHNGRGPEPSEMDSPANTHVLEHAGKILALCESGWPYAISPELDTIGMYGFGGKLEGPMTAHPKIDPLTGEMVLFGYSWHEPYLRYHVANAAGDLVHSTEIDVPGPTMMHDCAATATRTLFLDLPVVFDLEQAMGGGMPYHWSDDYGARIGVIPRFGVSADVRWFEIDACYIFHTFNAYDDGDAVVLDCYRYENMWVPSPDGQSTQSVYNGYPCRYRFDLGTGKHTITQISDVGGDFPRIDPGRAGLPYRYGYGARVPDNDLDAITGISKFDFETNTVSVFDVGQGHMNGEPIFCPADGQQTEDDGYLMAVNYDRAEDTSEVLIIDGRSNSELLARIQLPVRVPMGFHGSWIPTARIA